MKSITKPILKYRPNPNPETNYKPLGILQHSQQSSPEPLSAPTQLLQTLGQPINKKQHCHQYMIPQQTSIVMADLEKHFLHSCSPNPPLNYLFHKSTWRTIQNPRYNSVATAKPYITIAFFPKFLRQGHTTEGQTTDFLRIRTDNEEKDYKSQTHPEISHNKTGSKRKKKTNTPLFTSTLKLLWHNQCSTADLENHEGTLEAFESWQVPSPNKLSILLSPSRLFPETPSQAIFFLQHQDFLLQELLNPSTTSFLIDSLVDSFPCLLTAFQLQKNVCLYIFIDLFKYQRYIDAKVF